MLAAGLGPDARAGEAGLGRQIEQDRQIRHALRHGEAVQKLDGGQLDAARAALVGGGRIRKTVAEDDLAGGQRGTDLLAHMLGAGGLHQQQFGAGVHLLGAVEVLDERPQLFGQRRSARLPGNQRFAAARLQIPGEKPDLGAFPGAFRPFECDEKSLVRVFQWSLFHKISLFPCKKKIAPFAGKFNR